MSNKALATLDKFDAQWGMITRDELAEALRSVNVEALHRESGVAIKTIYRLRHKKHAPTLDTAAALLSAVDRLKAAEPKPLGAAA